MYQFNNLIYGSDQSLNNVNILHLHAKIIYRTSIIPSRV